MEACRTPPLILSALTLWTPTRVLTPSPSCTRSSLISYDSLRFNLLCLLSKKGGNGFLICSLKFLFAICACLSCCAFMPAYEERFRVPALPCLID